MNVSGFNHLTLRVRNLEQSLRFYCGLLGMKLVHKGRKDVYLEWGNAWICLLERLEESSAASGPGMDHVAFTIREPDFFHAVSLLKKNQVEMVREPVFRGGGWSVQFKDPDGIVLELFTGNLEKRMIHWTA
ncbi:glutathione transferase [Thermoactinomyces sp. AS95]|uniref:VOC family protein n=1 Tax=Thermoactinomyces sp. AS95 TaxID=1811386 RepID=UPI0007A03B2C|nr:VOC family protein [Thermoactinomyces sp. AS95]KYQ87179.1 glutathione transferase [Thermoactinomyces sp. AS95]